jgi:hypothetical protein
MARRFGSFEGFSGFTASAMRRMRKAKKIDAMVQWFGGHFEDPVERLPYITAEGGYQWIYGGPYDASEEIQGEFYDVVDFDTMMEAVEQVQEEGLFGWAPKSDPSDYEEEPEDDEARGPIVDGDGERPPVVEAAAPPEPVARAEVLRRLDELEALIIPLVAEPIVRPAMMGHNQPPEDLEIEQAVSRPEWRQVQSAIAEIREQAAAEIPSVEIVEQRSNRIRKALGALTRWLRDRANKAIDTGIGVSVIYGIANPDAIMTAMTNAVQAIQSWIPTLPL